ncbi:MAG: serine hydroxymethyltransferase [Planctomycetes bacterium]|nr:serine hydroxymethyltransferase [Planctomycetota bacterium]
MDKELENLIYLEQKRQSEVLRLIPSENYVSKNVRNALSSVLINKYSEGYPHHRYYEGTEIIDKIENLARTRAKNLFQAEHANVQPYSGSPANMAVYFSMLSLGDTILGMGLEDGGHLTHGASVNYSGCFYHAVSYHVDSETGLLNMDSVRKIAKKIMPKLIVCGGSAYPRHIDFVAFQEIAQEVGAKLLVDMSHFSGLVAGGVYPSPIPYADIVTTTTHKVLRGPRGGLILCKNIYAKDIDRAVFPGLQGGPHNHTIAGIASALWEASQDSYKEYTKQVIENAQSLAEELMKYGFHLVTGGTDTHLLLIDLRNFQISGKTFAQSLAKAGIITNANTVPKETGSPRNPSGLRLGTPAITTLGMKQQEMKTIAQWIFKVSQNIDQESILQKIKNEVYMLRQSFPFE